MLYIHLTRRSSFCAELEFIILRHQVQQKDWSRYYTTIIYRYILYTRRYDVDHTGRKKINCHCITISYMLYECELLCHVDIYIPLPICISYRYLCRH